MNKLITLLVLSLSILSAVLLPIKTASAGGYGGHHGYGNGRHYGIGYGHHNHHYHGNHYPHHYSRHSTTHRYNPSGYYANYPAQSYAYQARPCHQVYKNSYDEYGDAYRIGGTMCYNPYGEGYVVEGSRYEIR